QQTSESISENVQGRCGAPYYTYMIRRKQQQQQKEKCAWGLCTHKRVPAYISPYTCRSSRSMREGESKESKEKKISSLSLDALRRRNKQLSARRPRGIWRAQYVRVSSFHNYIPLFFHFRAKQREFLQDWTKTYTRIIRAVLCVCARMRMYEKKIFDVQCSKMLYILITNVKDEAKFKVGGMRAQISFGVCATRATPPNKAANILADESAQQRQRMHGAIGRFCAASPIIHLCIRLIFASMYVCRRAASRQLSKSIVIRDSYDVFVRYDSRLELGFITHTYTSEAQTHTHSHTSRARLHVRNKDTNWQFKARKVYAPKVDSSYHSI
ncbi:unnamed protein product, partial [Trichogramma brassicae]